MARHAGLARLAAAVLLGSGTSAALAETVELKFDWGPELKALVDGTPQPLQGRAGQAPGTTPSPGAAATPIPGSASTVSRAGPVGTRFRIAATRQGDGSYAVRVVDYLMRFAYADILISGDPRARQALNMMAPDVKFDPAGRFAGLLDPEAISATLEQVPRPSIEQRKDIPPEARERAQSQLRWMMQLRAMEARAAQSWVEAVGHWAGRRLEIGETYRATETVDAVALGPGPGPYQLERSWSALGREPCGKPADAKSGDGKPRDCVRLRLITRYTVSVPSIVAAGGTSTVDRTTFESEVTLLTEPATLRPHEILAVRRAINETAVPQSRELERSITTWTYGPAADVALKASFDPGKLPPGMGPPGTANPPPPARLWPARSPERMVADYFELVRARDVEGANKLLHPDLVGRAATRIRGPEGVRQSDEMRKTLVGEDTTLAQVDAMADDALFARVTTRATADGSGTFFAMPMGGVVEVIGHLLDSAGHAHIVAHSRMSGLPAQIAYRSFTVIADRLPEKPKPATKPGEVPLPACNPTTDSAGCWRIWLYDNVEFAPIFRRRFMMAPATGPSSSSPPPPMPVSPTPPAVIFAPGGSAEVPGR